MAHANFDGLRVLSLESRRAKEIDKLIRTYGGQPTVVPAMREIGLDSNQHVFEFAETLLAGGIDVIIFMTGVGVRAMIDIISTRCDREQFLEALRRTTVIARGPKPGSALRELKIPIAITADEPSTWRELLTAVDQACGPSLAHLRVAIQEYGATNPELISELSRRALWLTRVPVYQWALPLDLEPLQETMGSILRGRFDVILFMTAVQVIHLFQVAEQMGVASQLAAALQHMVVLSIGPTTSEELVHYGIQPDFEPSRPKMGYLVNEAAQYAHKLLAQKPKGRTAAMAGASTGQSRFEQPGLIRRVAPSTPAMAGFRDGLTQMDFLHEISSRFAAADPLHLVLDRIVAFIASIIPCDSCFLYVLETGKEAGREVEKLVLRASKVPHADLVDHVNLEIGQGVIGWVARHRQPVALASRASEDPRFKAFRNIPEDVFEAMLCTPILCAGRVIGVINLQHRLSYHHTHEEVRLLSTLGFLIGAEIERARLETENAQLQTRLETRKVVDRAKNILQRDLALTEEEAYQRMQRESRQRRKSMREIADAILLSDDLRQSQYQDQQRSRTSAAS